VPGRLSCSFFEIHALWASGADHRFARLAARLPGWSRTTRGFKGGVLVRRFGGQVGPVPSSFARVSRGQLLSWRTCPVHGRHLPPFPSWTAGHHPARREEISAVPEATVPKICAGGAQGRTGPACTRWPAPGSSPTQPIALPTANIAVMGAARPSTPCTYNNWPRWPTPADRDSETQVGSADEYEADIDVLAGIDARDRRCRAAA